MVSRFGTIGYDTRPAVPAATVPSATVLPRPAAAGRSTSRPPAAAAAQVRLERGLLLTAAATAVLELLALLLAPAPAGGAVPAVTGVVLAAFWLAGPGAVLAASLRVPAATRLALAPVLGLCLLVALSATGAWTGVWVPRTATAVVGLVTAVLAVQGWSRRRAPAGHPTPSAGARAGVPSRSAVLPAVLLTVAVALWALSLPAVRATRPSVLGLLATAPLTLPLAGLLAVGVLLAALRRNRLVTAAAAGAVLVLVLRTTAAASTAVPLYAWTYKHLGVVDALVVHRAVVPGADIYQNWPAMFSAAAWFSQTSGTAAVDVAQWLTPVVHVLMALQVAALARALGARTAGAVGAAVLVVPLNWVGQDYYAPQALAIVLGAGVLVLLVQSRRSTACAWLAVAVYGCLVPTHQLTPFWLLGTAVALSLLRRVPWWVTALLGVLVGAYVSSRFGVVSRYGLFSGFNFFSNAAGNIPDSTAAGRRWASVFARSSALAVWGSTLAVLAARVRRWATAPDPRTSRGRGWRPALRRALATRSTAVPAVVAFSAFGLLGGQSYGGEAILRVVLYTAPGCAAVLGPALVRMLQAGGRTAAAAAGGAVVVVALTAQAYFGGWYVNLIQPEDVAAAARLNRSVPPHALVLPVVPDGPDRITARHLELYAADPDYDAALSTSGYADVAYDRPQDLQRLRQDLTARGTHPIYVVFTASMREYDAFYGVFPPGGYEGLRRSLAGSPDWSLVDHEGDLWVYQYTAPGWPR